MLFRLRRPLTRPQIVEGFAANDRDDFDPRGSVAVVPTGGSWEATLGLSPGRYLVDLVVRWRTSEARWRFGLKVSD